MAKATADGLFKKLEALGSRSAAAMDELLQEQKAIREKAEEDVSAIQEKLDRLNNVYHSSTGTYYLALKKEGKDDGKRIRRPKEQLKADAKAMVDFIKSKGKEGASGKELKEKFPGVTGSLRQFVKAQLDVDLKDNGENKRALRWLA